MFAARPVSMHLITRICKIASIYITVFTNWSTTLEKRIVVRVVIQRVKSASVRVGERVTGSIGQGLLIFLGIALDDNSEDIDWLSRRVTQIRAFNDDRGLLNRSLIEVEGESLVVSQFTLYGNLRKGNRPSFNRAAPPESAIPLYESFVKTLSEIMEKPVATGEFGAMMEVEAINDGPVTLIIDSREKGF